MNYYYRHLGDYAKDTGHLTTFEHGVYCLLLDRYYVTEKGIPQAEVYAVAKATNPEERKLVDRVLRAFFKRSGKTWIKSRCDEEIARYHEKSGKAKESAKQRWQCERNAKAMRTHSDGNALQSPISNLQTKEKDSEALKTLPENPEGIRRISAIVSSIAQDHRTKESRR